MRTSFESRFRWTLAQRIGVFFLLSAILLVQLSDYVFNHYNTEPDGVNATWIVFPEDTLSTNEYQKFVHSSEKVSTDSPIINQALKVNFMEAPDWEAIGFSAKQSTTILKYRYSLGGNFKSEQEIKDCYVISEEMFESMKPFLDFTKNSSTKRKRAKRKQNKSESFVQIKPFNPNKLSKEAWVNLGFSDKQAKTILKYRKSLGGSFESKEQIKRCFVINDYMFNKIEPYIQLPSETETKRTEQVLEKTTEVIPLNAASAEEIEAVIGNKKVAKTLINFRRVLGGYAEMDQLRQVYGIDESQLNKLFQSVAIEEGSWQKINLKKVDESQLKKHPYTRKFSDEILSWKKEKADLSLESICKESQISHEDCHKILLYLVRN